MLRDILRFGAAVVVGALFATIAAGLCVWVMEWMVKVMPQ